MDQQPQDLDNFDESLIGLFTLLKTVIKTNEKHKLNLSSRKNPIMSRLEKYIKIYDRTEPEEHLWYFQKLFNQNRPAILRGPERDNWIKNGNIILHFGEEIKIPIRDAKVHLSIIYNTSIKLRDEMEEALDGLPDVEQSHELMYPTILLLHLYRIFKEICESDEDKSKMSGYIKDLENEAGIKKSKRSNNNNDDDNGLSGLMGMATGLMEQMGMKLPEGQKLPSGNELTSAISGVMQNPQAKSFLGDMMKDMQECNNFGDVVGKLLNKLPAGMNPGIKQTIQENASAALGNGAGTGNGAGNEADNIGSDGSDNNNGSDNISSDNNGVGAGNGADIISSDNWTDEVGADNFDDDYFVEE